MHPLSNTPSSFYGASDWLTETTTTCHEKEIGIKNSSFYDKKLQTVELEGLGYIDKIIENYGVFDSPLWLEMQKIPPLFPDTDDFDYTSEDSERNKRPLSSHHKNCDKSGNGDIFTEIKMNEPDVQIENSTKLLRTVKKPFQCNQCEKSFSRHSNLKIHIRMHNGEKPYQCKVCKKGFRHSSTLINHARTHTGDRPYRCNICEKSFKQLGTLTEHTRLHTGVRPYKCDECDKRFIKSIDLVNHTRTHTGEKQYTCEVCEKSFSLKKHLTRHKFSKRHLLKQAHQLSTEPSSNTGRSPLDGQTVKPAAPQQATR